jgi:hypothetical protein
VTSPDVNSPGRPWRLRDISIIVAVCMLGFSSQALQAEEVSAPERQIRELFRVISSDDTAKDRQTELREFFTEDALFTIGAGGGKARTLHINEALALAAQELADAGVTRIHQTPESVECRIVDQLAHCVASLTTSFPELTLPEMSSTANYTLRHQEDGNWLIAMGTNLVHIPESVEWGGDDFVMSYPILRSESYAGTQPKWEYALPFMAQQVVDMGYDLPKPYGLAIIPVVVRQDILLSDLSVAFNGGEEIPINFLGLDEGRVENTTLQLKLDAWLFPFMNVFVAIGKMDGDGDIPLAIEGGGLLDLIDPSICSGLLAPALCTDTIVIDANPNYEGDTLTLGTNLAAGWRQFFFTVPISYTWSDVDIIDSTVETIMASPRIGVTSGSTEWGVLSTFIGANWLDAEVDIEGKIDLGEAIEGLSTIEYKLTQKNKDKWNYLVGFNWDITENWSVHAEAGFGGSRENFISSLTYRF